MGSKYAHASYRVTIDDLAAVVNEHASEWGATAYFDIRIGGGLKSVAYVEISVRDGIFQPAGKELERVRWPLDGRDAGMWPGNMLHALMTAYSRLEAAPWAWPERKRRRVTDAG